MALTAALEWENLDSTANIAMPNTNMGMGVITPQHPTYAAYTGAVTRVVGLTKVSVAPFILKSYDGMIVKSDTTVLITTSAQAADKYYVVGCRAKYVVDGLPTLELAAWTDVEYAALVDAAYVVKLAKVTITTPETEVAAGNVESDSANRDQIDYAQYHAFRPTALALDTSLPTAPHNETGGEAYLINSSPPQIALWDTTTSSWDYAATNANSKREVFVKNDTGVEIPADTFCVLYDNDEVEAADTPIPIGSVYTWEDATTGMLAGGSVDDVSRFGEVVLVTESIADGDVGRALIEGIYEIESAAVLTVGIPTYLDATGALTNTTPTDVVAHAFVGYKLSGNAAEGKFWFWKIQAPIHNAKLTTIKQLYADATYSYLFGADVALVVASAEPFKPATWDIDDTEADNGVSWIFPVSFESNLWTAPAGADNVIAQIHWLGDNATGNFDIDTQIKFFSHNDVALDNTVFDDSHTGVVADVATLVPEVHVATLRVNPAAQSGFIHLKVTRDQDGDDTATGAFKIAGVSLLFLTLASTYHPSILVSAVTTS